MKLGTRLRDHIDRWLHPRDPLLEAWKDDPFVEAMVVREKKTGWSPSALLAPLLLRRWGCVPVFVASWILFGILLETQRSLNRYWVDGLTAIVLSIAVALLLRQGLILLGKRFCASASSQAPLPVVIQSTGPNPLLMDLWVSGVHGSDMVKALHVVLCRRRGGWLQWVWAFIFLLIFIMAWEPIAKVGLVGLLSYLLLLAWLRLVYVFLRYGQYNPLRAVGRRFVGVLPPYLSAAWQLDHPPDNEYAPPSFWVVLSGVLVALGLILTSLLGRPDFISPPIPAYILFGIQSGCLILACLMIIAIPIGPGRYFDERLQDALHLSDLEFHRFVREQIIQDPDARRQT
jgi:hypothetical protein